MLPAECYAKTKDEVCSIERPDPLMGQKFANGYQIKATPHTVDFKFYEAPWMATCVIAYASVVIDRDVALKLAKDIVDCIKQADFQKLQNHAEEESERLLKESPVVIEALSERAHGPSRGRRQDDDDFVREYSIEGLINDNS